MASTSKKDDTPPTRPVLRPIPRPPPIPPPQPRRFPYDVFMSFRGADTRNAFTDHLYTALVDSGIRTFRDDDELNPGGVIQHELMKAIEESRIAIIIFSKTYASSSWCLDELERIIECKKTTGKIVLPVFYNVDPSDVRWQTKSFAEAFGKLEVRFANEPDKLERWRSALIYAADLSGLSLQSFNGSESELIKNIVKEVLHRGKIKKMFVAKHPVGLNSHLDAIIPLLLIGSQDVRLIGIFGMGGIGKSVIAAALYNEILPHFESSCFLENVREKSARNGLPSLQEELLYQLSMGKNVKVTGFRIGIEIIKEMFGCKKVLIVLDDLDSSEQADALGGCHDWFGPGSRIIITTRYEKSLHDIKVDAKHRLQTLNNDKSLELFSLHSFGSKLPPHAYVTSAQNFADYCQGLPLALQVLGKYLSGKDISEWKSAFAKLYQVQPNDIHAPLKISYDGLDDHNQEIFLDIAFFFIGMDIDYVIEILNGCGFNTKAGIRDLRDRCLITVNRNNELRMHDLLRDMGREIIRRMFPKRPSQRSRLWIPEHVAEVLVQKKEAEAVEGVVLMHPNEKEIYFHTEMPNLRLLHMNKVNLKGNFEHLFCKIRWICWQEYPLNNLPRELKLNHIVVLDMQHSKMVKVWNRIQLLENLKILNLSHSKHLRSTPNFTKVQMLVTLIFEGCISLHEIHPSVGNLGSLKFLSLEDCKVLKTIPDEICNLRLLGYLNLNGCSKLEGLPENLGEIENLRELSADETSITRLPSSLGLLKSLMSLSLKGCNKKSARRPLFPFFTLRESSGSIRFLPPSICGLSALRRFNLRNCNLSDQDIPVDIGNLRALQELDLTGNSLSSLPQSFKHLTNLESLDLDNWNDLCSLLPSSLRSLVPTPSQSRQYNMFLRSRDSDTRDTFINKLYTALVEAGIHAYRDDHELNVGGTISAIEESRIVIVVLSTNYAFSTWCLDNLVRIIECQQTTGKVVFPVYYHVDRGSLAEAFQKHTAEHEGELDKVERWQSALSYTADLSGFSLEDFNGLESSLISHIIKEVKWELKKLFVAEHPVGLESCLKEMRSLLQLELYGEVRLIKISGEVGSGKTVIAKAVYNESLRHFDSSGFLEDIGKASARRPQNGVVYLQKQLLNQLGVGDTYGYMVENVAEGIKAIKETCRSKKVLIVLDGFEGDMEEQAYGLLGERDWYGPGSRIIIVTDGTCWKPDFQDDHFPTDEAYLYHQRIKL